MLLKSIFDTSTRTGKRTTPVNSSRQGHRFPEPLEIPLSSPPSLRLSMAAAQAAGICCILSLLKALYSLSSYIPGHHLRTEALSFSTGLKSYTCCSNPSRNLLEAYMLQPAFPCCSGFYIKTLCRSSSICPSSITEAGSCSQEERCGILDKLSCVNTLLHCKKLYNTMTV